MSGHDASLVDDYRLHRDDQRARAEREGLGYPEETSAFYGHPGAAPGHSSEPRLVLKDYLRGMRQTKPEDMAPHEREWQRGHDLGSQHAEQLDYDDDPEQVDFGEMHRQLATSPHPEHFQRGYSHGLQGEQMSAYANLVEIGDRLQFDVATKTMPMTRTAHISTDIMSPLHCPYCGSGSIIGRPDGTICCDFCTSCFTVTIAPMYLGYPQTVDGEAYDWPQGPADDMASGAAPMPGQADDEDEEEEADEEEPTASVGGASAPPFGKKSTYRTVTGALLPTDEFIRHLAIRHSDQPTVMAGKIKRLRAAG